MPQDKEPEYDVRVYMPPSLAVYQRGSSVIALNSLMNVLTIEYSFFQRCGGLGKNHTNIIATLQSKLNVLKLSAQLYHYDISITELFPVGEVRPFILKVNFNLHPTSLGRDESSPCIWIGPPEEMCKLDSARRPDYDRQQKG